MEGGALRSSTINISGDSTGVNHRRENDQKVGLMGNAVRRNRLSDITNAVSAVRPGGSRVEEEPENPKVMPCPSNKDYVAQLMKENAALLKLVGERNKIIEMTNIEMQKLRFDLQKFRQQNWLFARANSRMQAELNLSRDRLKALQHESRCTKAVLQVKNLEVEEKEKLKKQVSEKIGSEEGRNKCAEVAVDASPQADDVKSCNANRKRTLKDLPQGSTTAHKKEIAPQEKVERRRSLRRRSSYLKSETSGPMADSFKIEDDKVSDHSSHVDTSIQPDFPTPCSNTSTEQGKKEQQNGKNDYYSSASCNQEGRRSSVGRPLRKAAEKVASYKEKPINVKMRRVD